MKSSGGFRKQDFQAGNRANLPPMVSIITVVYNNLAHIEKTIQSVINQDFKNKEYIIIDGGSTDGTLSVVQKYDSQIDYWQSEPDKGIYDAMNKGLHLATGSYLLFLNSGDLLADPHVLKNVFSDPSPEVDVFYGETYLMEESGKILGTRSELTTRKLPEKLSWKEMQRGMVVSHQSFFVKRSLAPDYKLEYRSSADVDWVIECLKRSRKTVHVNLVISKYLIGGFSVKQQKLSWKERFLVYTHHYGYVRTIMNHFYIALRSLRYKMLGKSNY